MTKIVRKQFDELKTLLDQAHAQTTALHPQIENRDLADATRLHDTVAKMALILDDARRLGGVPPAAPEWGLTDLETRMAFVFTREGRASAQDLVNAVYGEERDALADALRNVYVFIHRLRKKLDKHSIYIERGKSGYWLDEEDLAKLRRGFGLDG